MGFPLDIALARGVRRHDFAAAHVLLRTGYNFGLAGTPAGSQAAEMLEGPAMFREVSGAGAAEAGIGLAALGVVTCSERRRVIRGMPFHRETSGRRGLALSDGNF